MCTGLSGYPYVPGAAIPSAPPPRKPAVPLKPTSGRRQLVVAVLVGLALTGGAIRHWAPAPSLQRDLGNLMLVLWLPVIGNVISYLRGKLPQPAPPPLAFPPEQPFTAQIVIAFTPQVADPKALREPLDPEQHLFALVIGRAGFRVRPPEAPFSYLGLPEVPRLALEFLRPEQARPHFPVGAPFVVLWGDQPVGKGTVLETLG